MKAYLSSHTCPGYGARIFVPRFDFVGHVFQTLKDLSQWGGHDKDTGSCLGFEFGPEQYKAAQVVLAAKGYTLEEIGEKNAQIVYPAPSTYI